MLTLHSNDVVLFQGDSITDGNRGRNEDPNHILGHGFACMISAKLGADNLAAQPVFLNRGQSGDGIQELLCRWRKDGILLRPTILNLLIGINDSSAFHSYGADGSGMPAERYEEILQMLLTDAYKELPGLETVLCEPFYLPYGEMGEREKRIKREVSGYAGVVKRLAEEFGCVFLPLQEKLKEASGECDSRYIVWDWVHPTMVGHEILTREWFRVAAPALERKRAGRNG